MHECFYLKMKKEVDAEDVNFVEKYFPGKLKEIFDLSINDQEFHKKQEEEHKMNLLREMSKDQFEPPLSGPELVILYSEPLVQKTQGPDDHSSDFSPADY